MRHPHDPLPITRETLVTRGSRRAPAARSSGSRQAVIPVSCRRRAGCGRWAREDRRGCGRPVSCGRGRMAPDDGMGETDPWRQFRRGDRDIAVARAFSSRARGVDRGHLDPLAGSAASFGAWVVNRSYAVAARFGLDLPGEAGHGEAQAWGPERAGMGARRRVGARRGSGAGWECGVSGGGGRADGPVGGGAVSAGHAPPSRAG